MDFKFTFIIQEKYWLLFLIFISFYNTLSPQFIRPVEFSKKEKNKFVTMPQDLSIDLFEMKNSYSNIHVDFGKQQEQIIVVKDANSVKLKLSFEIHSPLSNIYESVRNEFCYQISMTSEPTCNEIPKANEEMKWFNMNFSVKWLEQKTGFKLAIDPSSTNQVDVSGFYFFKSATPQSGIIMSNFLEIRDVLFWEKNVQFSTETVLSKYKENLSLSSIPKVFNCFDQSYPINLKDLPYWITLEFRSFVKWAWCPVSKQISNIKEIHKTYRDDCLRNSISKCDKVHFLCPLFLGRMEGWTEILSFDGTLTLTEGKQFSDYNNRLDGYALLCYQQSKSGYKALKYIANSYDPTQKEFTKGLQWVSTVNTRKEITPISPISQTVKVGILKLRFQLTAYYYAPSNYTYEWFKNKKRIFSSTKWTISPYSLQYNSKITSDMEGAYSLRVKSLSQIIEFIFNLEILSPPIIVNVSNEPIHSTVYLMVNSNYSISFMFKGQPKYANVYINGVQYKPGISDRIVFLKDLAQKAFNLKHLDFGFSEKKYIDGSIQYTYSVKNVSFPDTLLRGQDHNLIFEVVNEYGVSRRMLNIYVLKPPKFESLPKSDNCTTFCSSMQPHLFRCELNSEYYTNRDVQVEKIWLLNDLRLDSFPYHKLYFKNDSKGLNLFPIKSNNSEFDRAVKKSLKEAKLTCRVRLLYPGSLDMTEAKLINEKRIIYDNLRDTFSLHEFSAEIRLDWQPEPVTASLTWIIFLCIALVLIVMFLFLLVKFTLRGQGKSYPIEKMEIAQGYNRDEEIIENETIKPYLRSKTQNRRTIGCQVDLLPVVTVHYRFDKEKAPVVCCECNKDNSKDISYNSLNYSPSNGNRTFRPRDVMDIIDDEENAIDPSKFNEEGSFIGVYATKNNQTNLPPEIKINQL